VTVVQIVMCVIASYLTHRLTQIVIGQVRTIILSLIIRRRDRILFWSKLRNLKASAELQLEKVILFLMVQCFSNQSVVQASIFGSKVVAENRARTIGRTHALRLERFILY
jgi:uncharacterized membrane protein